MVTSESSFVKMNACDRCIDPRLGHAHWFRCARTCRRPPPPPANRRRYYLLRIARRLGSSHFTFLSSCNFTIYRYVHTSLHAQTKRSRVRARAMVTLPAVCKHPGITAPVARGMRPSLGSERAQIAPDQYRALADEYFLLAQDALSKQERVCLLRMALLWQLAATSNEPPTGVHPV